MDYALFLILLIVWTIPAIRARSLPLLKRELIAESNSTVYAPLCPDSLPGITTQIQVAHLESHQNNIYITDCSPSRHDKSSSFSDARQEAAELRLDKRQENICPADCGVSCDGGTAGSSSDCNTLIINLSSRGQSRTIAGFGMWQETYGTCACTFANTNASPIVYCDTSLANRCQMVVNQCTSGVSGKCLGSRFTASISKNSNAVSSPSPSPAADTPAPSQGTSGNNSSNGNGSNNNGNVGSTSNGSGNTGASTTAPNPGASSVSPGVSSLSGTSVAATGPHTGSLGPSTTTLADGTIRTLSAANVSIPSGNSESAGTSPNTSGRSNNTAAIVGAVLGVVAVILIIVGFLLWRRRRKAQEQLRSSSPTGSHHSQPYMQEDSPNDSPPEMEEAPVASLFASSSKARMAAEEPHRRTNTSSLLTASTIPSSSSRDEFNYVPPYRSRFSHSNHPQSENDLPSNTPSDTQRHRHRRREGSTSGSDVYSTITGSSGRSQRSAARTFAHAAAPNLSATDIDRLAENIVARMQGRDPRGHEGRISGSVMEGDEEEPPPPWSAPVA